jgi:hypothetical protein
VSIWADWEDLSTCRSTRIIASSGNMAPFKDAMTRSLAKPLTKSATSLSSTLLDISVRLMMSLSEINSPFSDSLSATRRALLNTVHLSSSLSMSTFILNGFWKRVFPPRGRLITEGDEPSTGTVDAIIGSLEDTTGVGEGECAGAVVKFDFLAVGSTVVEGAV